jgi:aerobic-type carbon monoxide dehydrogenase small subunit (CoxS/CutS family)
MDQAIRFTLNGEPVTIETDGSRSLLWVLRSDLGLTGTRHGCNQGHCGVCAVLIDGREAYACLRSVGSVAGTAVTTIEGLSDGDVLHPLQEAFIEHDALQCGYCTPGMILASVALLETHPQPTDADIVAALDPHLCRCGAHPRIVEAVHTAARKTSKQP